MSDKVCRRAGDKYWITVLPLLRMPPCRPPPPTGRASPPKRGMLEGMLRNRLGIQHRQPDGKPFLNEASVVVYSAAIQSFYHSICPSHTIDA